MALPAVAGAAAVTVSCLYWAQSIVGQAAVELGPSALLSTAPGASLLGYALGVAALAALAGDLASPGGLVLHAALLAAALCLAAAAPNAGTVALACLAIGAGGALTQRLLVIATTLVTRERQAGAIGTVIAAGLLGIVFARAIVPGLADAVGWRVLFVAGAAVVFAACLSVGWVGSRRVIAPTERASLPSPLSLLRSLPVARRAALEQAIAFAGFNLGWALFLGASAATPAARAAISTAGAGAALLSGSACRRGAAPVVARLGMAAIGAAALLAAAANAAGSRAAIFVAMALLEVGTQVALVANQARAQAAAPSVPIRGRVAATVTTVAFCGGAVGAAVGNLIR